MALATYTEAEDEALDAAEAAAHADCDPRECPDCADRFAAEAEDLAFETYREQRLFGW